MYFGHDYNYSQTLLLTKLILKTQSLLITAKIVILNQIQLLKYFYQFEEDKLKLDIQHRQNIKLTLTVQRFMKRKYKFAMNVELQNPEIHSHTENETNTMI